MLVTKKRSRKKEYLDNEGYSWPCDSRAAASSMRRILVKDLSSPVLKNMLCVDAVHAIVGILLENQGSRDWLIKELGFANAPKKALTEKKLQAIQEKAWSQRPEQETRAYMLTLLRPYLKDE